MIGKTKDKETRKERDKRLSRAWGIVMADYPDEMALKTGISEEELIELKIIRQERRRLFLTAFDNGLEPDMLVKYFGLTEIEAQIWWYEWLEKEGRVNEIFDE